MRKVVYVIVCSLIVGASIAAILWWHSFANHSGTSPVAQHSVGPTKSMHSEAPGFPGASSADTSVGRSFTPTNYKQLLSQSHNYWDYAHEILAAAKSGDPDAQYYLSKVVMHCRAENKMYFQHRGVHLTLDEGLQYAVKRHLPMDVAQSVYDRCHQFQDENDAVLGDPTDWLAKATASAQPLAEATTASRMFMGAQMRNFARAGGVENPSDSFDVKSDPNIDPRGLLRAAAESKDPEVLFQIGELQPFLDPSQKNELVTRFAWWLVACERGLDCSTTAQWVRNGCSADPVCLSSTSPQDLLRYLAGDNWADVQVKAESISAGLDAGNWDDLGLGP